MVELALAPKRKKPLGTRIQRKNEEAKPQISPAPGLVARRAKNNPKASPKAAPTSPPEESDVFSTTLWSKPPETPSTRPTKVSTRRESDRATSRVTALDSVSGTLSPLLQTNRLDDIPRKKKVDRPVHEHSNFALQTGQFRKVDSPPQEPSEQTGKANRSASHKGNG